MHFVAVLTPPVVGLRIGDPFHEAEVAELATDIRQVLQGVSPVTFCSDLRAIQVLSPSTADAIIELLRQDNPAVQRAAIFVKDNAVFALQIKRIVNSAGHPGRKVFSRKDAGIQWLMRDLQAQHRAVIEKFLDGA